VARRVTVPAADDIFRPTVVPQPEEAPAAPEPEPEPTGRTGRTASGRVKHDEKMTVYVTADELLDIEHARLELRRHHGLAVDRGRLVRAAVALALADLDAHGAESAVVQRLQES
jgi:hypothetical protein